MLDKTLQLCKLYGIKPSRSKGQNFLVNEQVYDAIVESADLNDKDVVLEIGPGLGFLTAKLAAEAKRVIAVELDDKIFSFLEGGLVASGTKNIELINSDILQLQDSDLIETLHLQNQQYKIVANLPYNITSIFLRKFISEITIKPSSLVLMLQKEVAERVVAKPGKMSLLAVAVQFYAEVELLMTVPSQDFYPAPQVDSAVVKIKLKNEIPDVDVVKFFRLVKFGFSAKRKMLKNNLANGLHITNEQAEELLSRVGLDTKIRAQALSLADWRNLYNANTFE